NPSSHVLLGKPAGPRRACRAGRSARTPPSAACATAGAWLVTCPRSWGVEQILPIGHLVHTEHHPLKPVEIGDGVDSCQDRLLRGPKTLFPHEPDKLLHFRLAPLVDDGQVSVGVSHRT